MNTSAVSPTSALVRAAPLAGRSGVLFSAAWFIMAAGTVGLLWVLVGVWAAQPEMNDRALIPLASALIAYRQRSRWLAQSWQPTLIGLLPLALGAAAFPVGWNLLVQVGPRVVLLWWLLSSLVVAATGRSFVLFVHGY